MYISLTGNSDNKDVYIKRSYRKSNGKTATQIHRKLGKLNELLEQFSGDYDAMMAWAKAEAQKDTMEYNAKTGSVTVSLSKSAHIPKNEERCFQAGYLFLQKLCTELKMDSISQKISRRHKYTYDLSAVLTGQIFSRILAPSSKLGSYSYCQTLLEPPKYELHDIYRALSVMAEESDFIQEELYRNSNFVHPRNKKILYYDCTNYYFEIEQEDGDKKYGKCKEHRPNPIIQMGLFMDGDGIPLAFSLFPGNANEQTSLKPLEEKVLSEFGCQKFIYCSDAGLGSEKIRNYNHMGERAFIVTQSIKKLKAKDKEWALNPCGFKRVADGKNVDITALSDDDTSLYYKEEPYTPHTLHQRLIVTYSPKYARYQKMVRDKQVDRARKMLDSGSVKKERKNPNDPARFIGKTAVTADGEAAKIHNYLDEDKIQSESLYDGLYAVSTDLLDDEVGDILKVSEGRWEIEECFRILKTDFEARPIFLQNEIRIKAHFLTCFISLVIYRYLEKALGDFYTCETILSTLKGMNFASVQEQGFMPLYKRDKVTDRLHEICNFRTDYEFITKRDMKTIQKKSKGRE